MVKRSAPGSSRAARKAARVRRQRAAVRGLPVQPEPAPRAVETPLPRGRGRQAAVAANSGSRFSLLAKVIVFLVLLMAAVWGAARYRHGLLD